MPNQHTISSYTSAHTLLLFPREHMITPPYIPKNIPLRHHPIPPETHHHPFLHLQPRNTHSLLPPRTPQELYTTHSPHPYPKIHRKHTITFFFYLPRPKVTHQHPFLSTPSPQEVTITPSSPPHGHRNTPSFLSPYRMSPGAYRHLSLTPKSPEHTATPYPHAPRNTNAPHLGNKRRLLEQRLCQSTHVGIVGEP